MPSAPAPDRYETMNYRRCERSGLMLPAVSLVDILDDLLAAIGGEIDVNVGHGARLARFAHTQKALKEQVVVQGVHGRDAQQVGH